MIGREPLQRADTQERFIVPDCPEADVGGLQPGKIQGVRAARRCLRAGAGEMELQEIDYPQVTPVAGDDPYHAGLLAGRSPLHQRAEYTITAAASHPAA